MLAASQALIERRLSDDALVLDVGGWGKPFERADWVLDMLPYETRGHHAGPGDPARERFGPDTWVVRDICDREPWPFESGQFDFAICSHTLEDVRDPIRVCSELTRVARAGYVEVPSRFDEQSPYVNGPWVGWAHHRWLVSVVDGGLEFVFKSAVLQGRDEFQFPNGFATLLEPEQRVLTLFWESELRAWERIFVDPIEIDSYLGAFVTENAALVAERVPTPSLLERLRWRAARLRRGRRVRA